MVVWRSAAIAGKPGRYISIEKGLMVDNIPRIKMTTEYCFLFMAAEGHRNGMYEKVADRVAAVCTVVIG